MPLNGVPINAAIVKINPTPIFKIGPTKPKILNSRVNWPSIRHKIHVEISTQAHPNLECGRNGNGVEHLKEK